MNRRQRTIRGVDDDAWEMLGEVAALNRTARGALVTDAIRFWYAYLEEDDPNIDPNEVAGRTTHLEKTEVPLCIG